jgi:hypothetical protein
MDFLYWDCIVVQSDDLWLLGSNVILNRCIYHLHFIFLLTLLNSYTYNA